MSPFRVPLASNLPKPILRIAAIGMIFIWIALAFWSVIFISRGMIDFVSFFPSDRFYGIVYTVIGVTMLLQIRMRLMTMRKQGLLSMVKQFLETRFLEIIATTMFMLIIALIVSYNIEFIASAILLLPLYIGTSLGFSLGQFMEQILHIPYASFLVLTSSWLLELFWLYLFSWFFIRILLRFRLISKID
jgi:hypothetical protein